MIGLLFGRGGGGSRGLMLVRVALLVATLVAVLVLHANGTELVVLKVARIALVVAVLGAAGAGRARRERRRAS